MTFRRKMTMTKRKQSQTTATLSPPPYLCEDAAAVWRVAVAQMVASGNIEEADGPTIETYCAAVVRQRRITAEIDGAPLTGSGKMAPLLRVAEATAATVKNLGHVLGLNPAARQRLPKAPQKVGGGKWDDLD
jgi:P27 family predicted phage terminase small subunit